MASPSLGQYATLSFVAYSEKALAQGGSLREQARQARKGEKDKGQVIGDMPELSLAHYVTPSFVVVGKGTKMARPQQWQLIFT
jgi:hypothetical protein